MNCRKLIDRNSTCSKPALPKPLLAALLLIFVAAAAVPRTPLTLRVPFSLSTTRTFAPGESVKIQLIAHNVPELEFRVYKVRDAEKFFAGLKDVHSFGVQNYAPQEQIDQETFVERLHDFKAHFLVSHSALFPRTIHRRCARQLPRAAGKARQAEPGCGCGAVRADSAAQREPTGGSLET